MAKKATLLAGAFMILLFNIQADHPGDFRDPLTAEQWLNHFRNRIFTGDLIEDYRLKQAPLSMVIQSMSDRLGIPIHMPPELERKVTYRAVQVPWDEALFHILTNQRLTLKTRGGILVVSEGEIRGNPGGITAPDRKVPPEQTKHIPAAHSNPLDRFARKHELTVPVHPDQILVNHQYIYIGEREKIHVYQKKKFNYVRTFGRKGQGPREFQPYSEISGAPAIRISLLPDRIFVGSLKKFSLFTPEGEFLSETVTENPIDFSFSPLEKNTVGIHQERFPQWRLIFNLYDQRGKKIREICSRRKNVHTGKRKNSGFGLVFQNKLSTGPRYAVFDGKIFITGVNGMSIDIFDRNGNTVRKIRPAVPRRQINSREKENILGAYKSGQTMERLWPRARKIISIPDHYPPFHSFQVTGGRVYVQTFRRKDQQTEFFIFNTAGKFLDQIFLPLLYRDFLTPHPYVIFNDVLYQLYDNQDTESWELYVSKTE